jgi:thiamine pyrophosphokinase
MKRAALAGALECNVSHLQEQEIDFTVAVDRGFQQLQQAGMRPDVVLGDFDSLGYTPVAPDVRVFPCEKDESDMELACRVVEDSGAREVLLYGCMGGRLDHTLANLQLMTGLARRGVRAFAIGADFAVAALHGEAGAPGLLAFGPQGQGDFSVGSYGNFISAFAVGGPARGVTETGLKYVLNGAAVPDEVSLGLSNEFTGRAATIGVEQGDLIVTFPLAAWRMLKRD